MTTTLESNPIMLFVLGGAIAALLALLLYKVFARMQSWSEAGKFKADYYTARADLETARSETALLRNQVTGLVESRDALATNLDLHKKARVTLESRIDAALAEKQNLLASFSAEQQTSAATRAQLEQTRQDHANALARADELSARVKALEEAGLAKDGDLARMSEVLEKEKQAQAELRGQISDLGQTRAAMKVEMDALAARALETSFALDNLEKAQGALKQKEDEIAGHAKSHASIKAELEATQKAGAALEAKVRELTEAHQMQARQVTEAETLKAELEKERRIKGEIEGEYKKLAEELAQAEKQNRETAAQLAALKTQVDENDAVQAAATHQLKASLDTMLANRVSAERRAAEAVAELERVRTSTASRMAALVAEANVASLALKRKDDEIASLQKTLAGGQMAPAADEAPPIDQPEPLAWQPPAPEIIAGVADEAPAAQKPHLPAQLAPAQETSPQPEPAPAPQPKPPRARLAKPRSILSGLRREAVCPQYLSEVRGIGEVYEKRLYAEGIGTFWELAHTTDEELERIFDARDFQEVNCQIIRDDAMRLAIETGSLGREWDGSAPDDLTQIPGIGRTFERRLFDAGICTYEALAELSPARLEEICGKGALRRPNFAEWISEANARIT